MTHIKREITEQEYKQAQEQGPRCLISEAVICGYGCYGARTIELDGKYYLEYERGDSCD